MGFFGNKKKLKELVVVGTVCKICGMNFAANDRLLRHMVKAHGKAKKDHSSCPNC